jgi:hypothetical protein
MRGHVVVASADSEAFTSLRRRSTSRLDRYRMGKQLRRQVPRSSLGDWSVQADRPDPVQLIIESHRGRLDWLLPLRVGRMTATPYGFLRGAATVMPSNPPPAPRRGPYRGPARLGRIPGISQMRTLAHQPESDVGQPCRPCAWPYTDRPVMRGSSQPGALSPRRTERRGMCALPSIFSVTQRDVIGGFILSQLAQGTGA